VVATTAAWLTSVGYPPKIGGYWSSGLPFLDNAPKWTKSPWDAGFQLPLFEADVKELATFVEQLPPEMWTHEWQEKHSAVMGGRYGNMAMFKPGVEAIVLLFSAGDGTGPVYQFPAYELFAPLIEPLVTEVGGVGAKRAWGLAGGPGACVWLCVWRGGGGGGAPETALGRGGGGFQLKRCTPVCAEVLVDYHLVNVLAHASHVC
jgi:hypothetical protein